MQFYKAKYDAANPMRQQLNVPTNTDFMVGTELYVKGEKKEITAENVKLIDGIVEVTGVASPSESTEAFTLSSYTIGTSTLPMWIANKDFTLRPELYSVDGTSECFRQKNPTILHILRANQQEYTNGTVATTRLEFDINGDTYKLYTPSTNKISDYQTDESLKALYKTYEDGTPLNPVVGVKELLIPAGTELKAGYFMSGGVYYNQIAGGFNFTSKYDNKIDADTDVNGIPAFTMKSLDVEADKLFDVEFKSEANEMNIKLSESCDILEFSEFELGVGYKYTATKDIQIVPPFYMVGANYVENAKYTSDIQLKNDTSDWIGGTKNPMTKLFSFNVDGVLRYVVPLNATTLRNAGMNVDGKKLFAIVDASYNYYPNIVIPAGTTVTFRVGSAYGSTDPLVKYFTLGESYDYRFKLFINEDELAYGDVQVGQEFENTITLSGTYEDDTTFSYTIPVVED